MAAPVPIAHTHVHSLRIVGGAEALVARVLTTEGIAGYGFTLNLDAAAARDMAAWDALARGRNVPFHALFGARRRDSVAVLRDDGRREWLRVDPFGVGSLEIARAMAGSAREAVALVSPHAHHWEIACCAALAASLIATEVCIVLATEPGAASVAVPDLPGIGVDWSLEPAFGAIRW